MSTCECRLTLVQRPHPVVDGWPYDGEILRFRLSAGPSAGHEAHAATVELRITRSLLARPGWERLRAREVALHGHAFLREALEREGLPAHDRPVYVLDERTWQGACLDGPPWTLASIRPEQPFALPTATAAPATEAGAAATA